MGSYSVRSICVVLMAMLLPALTLPGLLITGSSRTLLSALLSIHAFLVSALLISVQLCLHGHPACFCSSLPSSASFLITCPRLMQFLLHICWQQSFMSNPLLRCSCVLPRSTYLLEHTERSRCTLPTWSFSPRHLAFWSQAGWAKVFDFNCPPPPPPPRPPGRPLVGASSHVALLVALLSPSFPSSRPVAIYLCRIIQVALFHFTPLKAKVLTAILCILCSLARQISALGKLSMWGGWLSRCCYTAKLSMLAVPEAYMVFPTLLFALAASAPVALFSHSHSHSSGGNTSALKRRARMKPWQVRATPQGGGDHCLSRLLRPLLLFGVGTCLFCCEERDTSAPMPDQSRLVRTANTTYSYAHCLSFLTTTIQIWILIAPLTSCCRRFCLGHW